MIIFGVWEINTDGYYGSCEDHHIKFHINSYQVIPMATFLYLSYFVLKFSTNIFDASLPKEDSSD